MLFTSIYKNPVQFLNIFEAICGISDTVNLHISSDNFKIEEMDESHTSFVQLEIDKDDFSEYSFSGGSDVVLGLNLKEFIKILKCYFNNDTINIKYDSNNSDVLEILFNGSSIERAFRLKLMTFDKQQLAIPILDYDLELDISTKLYSNVIESILTTDAKELNFNVKDTEFDIYAKGDISDVNLVFIKDNFEPNKTINLKTSQGERKLTIKQKPSYKIYDMRNKFNISFGIQYFKKIAKANSLVNKLSINLSENMPIKIDYMLNEDTGSIITYYIAPKISD